LRSSRSTVCRYFANKDAVLLDPIERTVGVLAGRLWDLVSRERLLLEDAVAERSGRDQLWNAAAAHLTLVIVGMAHDHDRDSSDETAPADALLATLREPWSAR
jgi:AcrR family transcriptional regulator